MLAAMYGTRFADAYRGTDPSVLRAVWREHLRGFTAAELERGIEACKTKAWPPTLPEFALLCRPALDHEEAYYEAVEQMRLREKGADHWSSPVTFHAAASLGNDLRGLPYIALKARWRYALDRAAEKHRDGLLPPIPPRPAALITAHRSPPTLEQRARVREMLAGLTAKFRTKPPGA